METDVALELQKSVVASQGSATELTLCEPAPFGSFAPPQNGGKARGKPKSKKRRDKKKSKTDLTATFHQKIVGFVDVVGALAMIEDEQKVANIDFERPVSTSSKAPQDLPALHFLLFQYQSMPLRLRPSAALRLAELIVEAGADVSLEARSRALSHHCLFAVHRHYLTCGTCIAACSRLTT